MDETLEPTPGYDVEGEAEREDDRHFVLESIEPDEMPDVVIVADSVSDVGNEAPDGFGAPEAAEFRREGLASAGVLEAIAELGERVERRIDVVKTLIEREGRAEATREKVVDRLHAELQEYKQDLLLKTLRPVFIDLIQLHDDIGKVAVSSPESSPDAVRLVELMLGFQQGIEDVLYRQGVEPFRVEGDAFDPRRQRAVQAVPTDDPLKNKGVAGRHRPGFLSGEKVIRPEVVSVYAWKA